MECLDINELKEFSKKLHLVVLPSPLWAVHIDPEYQFIAIIHIHLESVMKLKINKGILLTFDKTNNVINASFFIHDEIVYLPELNNTIKSVVDLSHIIYSLHNLKLCVNIDNSLQYPQCTKYIEFEKYDLLCEFCLCANRKEKDAILWKDFNSYSNSLSPEDVIANNLMEDNLCCPEIDTNQTMPDKITNYNHNTTNMQNGLSLQYTEVEWQENYDKSNASDSSKIKTKSNRRCFSCKQCDRNFLTKSHLQEHLRSHNNEKPFLCEICNKTSSRRSVHQKHLQTHSNTKRNLCNICGKTYCQGYRMKDHLLTHSSERPFECEICHKSFAKNYNLKLHKKTHLGIRPFICSVCGKTYTTQSNLATHVRSTHTNKKPHACTNCDMSFVHPRHLRIHMRKHTGEKPYNCVVCGKTFAKNIHLTIHMRIHTGEKPHLCTICGKGFTTTGNLSSHKKVHHKDIDNIK